MMMQNSPENQQQQPLQVKTQKNGRSLFLIRMPESGYMSMSVKYNPVVTSIIPYRTMVERGNYEGFDSYNYVRQVHGKVLHNFYTTTSIL